MFIINRQTINDFAASAATELWDCGLATGYFATIGLVRSVRDIERYCTEMRDMNNPSDTDNASRVVTNVLLPSPAEPQADSSHKFNEASDTKSATSTIQSSESPENNPLPSEEVPKSCIAKPSGEKKGKSVRFAMEREHLFLDVELTTTNKSLTKDDTDHMESRAQTLLDLLESDELQSVRIFLQFEFFRDAEIYNDLTSAVLTHIITKGWDKNRVDSFETMASESFSQERLLMMSSADVSGCSIGDARDTIASLERKIGKLQAASPVDNLSRITRYQLTIVDLLVAVEAAEQKEGPTRKNWIGGTEKKEQTPFIQQFRRTVNMGDTEQVRIYIRNLRSLEVLQSLKIFLANTYCDPVFTRHLEETIKKRQNEVQQLVAENKATPETLITTTLPRQLRKIRAYLNSGDVNAAALYIRKQTNPDMCQQIKQYLESTNQSKVCLSAVEETINKL